MTLTFDELVDDADWAPMPLDQQGNPSYHWHEGGLLADAPVDFAATFDDAMWVCRKPVDIPKFNRNPLRVRPNFTVPKHHHNVDEMLLVFAGEFTIEVEDPDGIRTVRVGPGDIFISRAETVYTMTAGNEGVTYFETWPTPVTTLETTWHDRGWVHR